MIPEDASCQEVLWDPFFLYCLMTVYKTTQRQASVSISGHPDLA